MADSPMKPQLWTPRPVEETVEVYRDWAATYDDDLAGRGYHTPRRIAAMLGRYLPPGGPVLDFGCGTGISGAELALMEFAPIDGTDITDRMVEIARTKGIYRKLWVGEPGAVPANPGKYRAIAAAGVISLGAAPPETLDLLIEALAPGGLIALSFNDPTLADGSYDAHLEARVADGAVTVLDRAHGPHLGEMGRGSEMGSDVMVLRRT